jgi:hypothetical protein
VLSDTKTRVHMRLGLASARQVDPLRTSHISKKGISMWYSRLLGRKVRARRPSLSGGLVVLSWARCFAGAARFESSVREDDNSLSAHYV